MNVSVKVIIFFTLSVIIGALSACKKDPAFSPDVQKTGPTPYEVNLPGFFPPMPINEANPLTNEGVTLGRMLFYEKRLSGNNRQSCAGCHQQNASFTDKGNAVSKGADGFDGFRNTMPLFNLSWASSFNWDGKFNTLEAQVLSPIILPFEMHENLDNAVSELESDAHYPALFRSAFGTDEINADRISKALAQFLKTIIAFNPKIVPGLGEQLRTPQENRGFQVFLDEKKGDCFHCHEVNVFATNFRFVNNGLNANPGLDAGLYNVTGNAADIGKFKTPSLLNLKYTAPYMHDGRFNTLEEVLDFYDKGFHDFLTLDPNLKKHLDAQGNHIPRTWTAQDKKDLLAFLLSLSDSTLLYNQQFSKP